MDWIAAHTDRYLGESLDFSPVEGPRLEEIVVSRLSRSLGAGIHAPLPRA